MSNAPPRFPPPTLVIAQFFWPERIGSAPYCTEAATWLAAQGATVEVLAARPHYPSAEAFPEYQEGLRDRESVLGTRILRVPVRARQGSGAGARMRSEGSFLRAGLARILTRQVTRRAHVLAFCPSMLALLLGRLASVRGGRLLGVVHDIQSGLASGLGLGGGILVGGMRLAERWLLNRCDALIVLSEAMRRELQEMGVTRPIHVLSIWADTTRIRPLARPPGAPPTALYSGNFGRKQGLEQLFDMAPRLSARLPGVRLLLRGEGAEKARLEEWARARQLTAITFAPLVSEEEFPASLAEGDVHLVPQNPAGSNFAVPSKVYSILAAGRPLVCTARPDSSLWQLAQDSGALVCVPPGNPEPFAQAVADLLQDEPRRAAMGERGRRWVEKWAPRDRILAHYAAILWGPDGAGETP